MLSFVKQCKWITDNRSLSLLLTLSFVLAAASTLAEAMQVKRAGFVGMRGKKSSSTLEGLLEDLYENDPDIFYDTHKRQGCIESNFPLLATIHLSSLKALNVFAF